VVRDHSAGAALVCDLVRTGPPRAVLAPTAVVIVLTFLLGGGLSSGSSAAPGSTTSARAAAPSARTALVALSIDELRTRIDTTSAALRVATDEYEQLDSDFSAATRVTEELRDEAVVVAEETLRNAIDGYRNGEIPRSILSAEDVNSSMRATALGGAAVSADTAAFDAYRTLRKDLEITESELVLREELVADAQVEMTLLESQLTDELIRFGELEERRIQQEAAGVSVQAANRAQARGRKQGFYLDTCPINGDHNFIDSWGFARSGGRRHKGVDMLARIGTELVAPVSGRVEHYSNSVGGRSYRIFGDDGNYFYGTHLSGFAKQGQVNAGEVIGYVGDDGNAAGIPHLHFEIHPGGRGNPINPYIDVAAVCSGDR